MEFLTDKIREKIYNTVIDRDNINSLFEGDKFDYNFELLVIDYFNVLNFKKIIDSIDEHDKKHLCWINNNTVQELKILIQDIDFVKSLLAASISFYELSTLDKQQIVRMVYNSDIKNDLTSRLLYHVNYMSHIPSYELHKLIDYYEEYIRINGKDIIHLEEGSNIIMGYLAELKLSDEKKYEEIILYALTNYYKLMTFLKRDCKKDIYYQDLIFVKKIELYGPKRLLNCVEKDSELLYEVIKQCLYYKTLAQPVLEEADEYLDKKLSKRIKRKLRYLSGNNE